MLRRTPRFSRTRMNESSYTGRADYGRLSYYWSMTDEFEMTDDLNKQIQNVMFNYSDAFYIEKLEDLLSDIFDTKVEHRTCSIRSKSFALSFTGKKVFLASLKIICIIFHRQKGIFSNNCEFLNNKKSATHIAIFIFIKIFNSLLKSVF